VQTRRKVDESDAHRSSRCPVRRLRINGILSPRGRQMNSHSPNLDRAFRIAASSFGKRFTPVAMRYLAISRKWRRRDLVSVAYKVWRVPFANLSL
jgi:hypothetical protein